ncbi:hypothetical protein D5086_007410 [Populus alba]|uniref:Uncharacterized protein n=1 Tax=Populus alba TaxID=43335 RepID=A0ACC4CNF4_POPAL
MRPYFLLNVRRSGECESILHVLRGRIVYNLLPRAVISGEVSWVFELLAHVGNSGIGEMQLCLIPPFRLLHLILWWFSTLYMAANIVRGVINLCYWFGYGVGELIRDDAGVRDSKIAVDMINGADKEPTDGLVII